MTSFHFLLSEGILAFAGFVNGLKGRIRRMIRPSHLPGMKNKADRSYKPVV